MLLEIANPIIYAHHMSLLQDFSIIFVPSTDCEEDTGSCFLAVCKVNNKFIALKWAWAAEKIWGVPYSFESHLPFNSPHSCLPKTKQKKTKKTLQKEKTKQTKTSSTMGGKIFQLKYPSLNNIWGKEWELKIFSPYPFPLKPHLSTELQVSQW